MPPSDEFDDDDWPELDLSTLNELERIEQAAVKTNTGLAQTASTSRLPTACPISNNNNATTSNNQARLQQKDLFGNTIPVQQASTSSYSGAFAAGPCNPVKAVVRKHWDRTVYAKSGVRRSKGKAKGKDVKGKGKGKARHNDDDEDEEEDEDFSDNDPLFDPEEAKQPPKPMKLLPDREACKTFVYPTNKSLRKYQFDIIAKAFYTDTLVALPTGLGKTFLAAVLMYNYYRWFPKGKIVFMAPSRPLVTQQISACHGIVGIPLKDAVELTGKDLPERRAEAWQKRRVFYCTPQTVKNDLFKGRLDPSDIVLMVVDEAHKATGDYAYCEVVRFMMQKNPHFRLLALTATPGSNAEVVQSVIDSLHIGHIERIDLVKIPVQGELATIRERYANLMNILLKQVRDLVKTQKTDPTTMHPYLFQSAMQNVKASGKPWAYSVVSFLGAMARCISKLLEQSVDSFYEELQGLRKSAKGKAVEVINHRDFASIYRDTEDMINGQGFAGHPKMVRLAELVQEHFEQAKKDGCLDTTRIMVFCTYRQVVDEIVQRLNAFDGVRATRLVGQGTDTKGKKGLGQKQQNKTLADFKKGDFNVLVATSIGEEGLDIGELDLIICYDAAKSPVRTLQRAGRTGRARDGRVIVLMTEGLEEDNWKIANSKYKDVQNAILSGKQFELYADCQRLVPADIRPIADKKELVIEPFDPEHMGLGRKAVATGKRKRNEEDNLDLFESGFQKANGRKVLSKTKAAVTSRESSEEDIGEPVGQLSEDGKLSSSELSLIQGRLSTKPQLSNIKTAVINGYPLPRKVPAPIMPTRKMFGTSARTASLLNAMRTGQELSANSDKNKAWEIKTYSAFKSSNVHWWSEESVGTGRDRSFRPLSHEPHRDTGASASMHLPPRKASAAIPATLRTESTDLGMEDCSLGGDIPPTSAALAPGAGRFGINGAVLNPLRPPKDAASAIEIKARPPSPRSKNKAKPSVKAGATPNGTIITIDDSDDDLPSLHTVHPGATKPVTPNEVNAAVRESRADTTILDLDSDDMFSDFSDMNEIAIVARPGSARVRTATDQQAKPSSPGIATIPHVSNVFKPHLGSTSGEGEDSPVIAPKKRAKRVAIVTSSPDKGHAELRALAAGSVQQAPDSDPSVVLVPNPQGKRLRRAQENFAEPVSKRPKQPKMRPEAGVFFDTIAVNSDNEDSASCTSEEEIGETTSDRVFLDSEDIANPNDMSAFYRESLMSQAADTFGNGVFRPGAFKMRVHGKPLSECDESPVEKDESQPHGYEPSQYVQGSFCVADSDDVVYSQRDDDFLDDD